MAGVEDLLHLTELYLHHNLIRKIEHLEKLALLKKLSLSYNCISRLEGLEGNHLLEDLDLAHQMLPPSTLFTFDEHSLVSIPKLTTLDIEYSNVINPEPLYFLSNCKALKLKGNGIMGIAELERVLKCMPLLEIMTILENPIVMTNKKYRDCIVVAASSLGKILHNTHRVKFGNRLLRWEGYNAAREGFHSMLKDEEEAWI